MKSLSRVFTLVLAFGLVATVHADWQPARGPLLTRWAIGGRGHSIAFHLERAMMRNRLAILLTVLFVPGPAPAEKPAPGPAVTPPAASDPNKKIKEIAGTAEFLRLLPKPFATLKAFDAKARTVALLFEGEKVAK